MTDQSWLHRKAPTGLKYYKAWENDPNTGRPPSPCWICIAVLIIGAGGLCIWGVSALRWMGWL